MILRCPQNTLGPRATSTLKVFWQRQLQSPRSGCERTLTRARDRNAAWRRRLSVSTRRDASLKLQGFVFLNSPLPSQQRVLAIAVETCLTTSQRDSLLHAACGLILSRRPWLILYLNLTHQRLTKDNFINILQIREGKRDVEGVFPRLCSVVRVFQTHR